MVGAGDIALRLAKLFLILQKITCSPSDNFSVCLSREPRNRISVFLTHHGYFKYRFTFYTMIYVFNPFMIMNGLKNLSLFVKPFCVVGKISLMLKNGMTSIGLMF